MSHRYISSILKSFQKFFRISIFKCPLLDLNPLQIFFLLRKFRKIDRKKNSFSHKTSNLKPHLLPFFSTIISKRVRNLRPSNPNLKCIDRPPLRNRRPPHRRHRRFHSVEMRHIARKRPQFVSIWSWSR